MSTWPKHCWHAFCMVWAFSGGDNLGPQTQRANSYMHRKCKCKTSPTFPFSIFLTFLTSYYPQKGKNARSFLGWKSITRIVSIKRKMSRVKSEKGGGEKSQRRALRRGKGEIGLYRVMQLGCLFGLAGPLKEAAQTNWLHPTGCLSVPALLTS